MTKTAPYTPVVSVISKENVSALIAEAARLRLNLSPSQAHRLTHAAYGYAQAQNPTWDDYIKSTKNRFADRDDFGDAIDFIGWYTDQSQRQLGISKWDAYNQYLAYHDGRGGFKRGTHKKKAWLLKVARKVDSRSRTYSEQLKSCKSELDDKTDGWF